MNLNELSLEALRALRDSLSQNDPQRAEIRAEITKKASALAAQFDEDAYLAGFAARSAAHRRSLA